MLRVEQPGKAKNIINYAYNWARPTKIREQSTEQFVVIVGKNCRLPVTLYIELWDTCMLPSRTTTLYVCIILEGWNYCIRPRLKWSWSFIGITVKCYIYMYHSSPHSVSRCTYHSACLFSHSQLCKLCPHRHDRCFRHHYHFHWKCLTLRVIRFRTIGRTNTIILNFVPILVHRLLD